MRLGLALPALLAACRALENLLLALVLRLLLRASGLASGSLIRRRGAIGLGRLLVPLLPFSRSHLPHRQVAGVDLLLHVVQALLASGFLTFTTPRHGGVVTQSWNSHSRRRGRRRGVSFYRPAHGGLEQVEDGDLDPFFEHWNDDDALQMAAFTPADAKNRAAFEERWRRMRSDPSVLLRTIEIAGRRGRLYRELGQRRTA